MEPVRIEILLNDRVSPGVTRARNSLSNLKGDARSANREMQELDNTTRTMDRTFRRLAGAFAIKELASKISSVRGEVQQLEVAFRTMLGSATKADELLQQLVRTAAITPFGLEDVANGAKQLLAYGLGAEKVNETLIRLGDIAAGLSVPLNDLVYLYGTTMSQGRLYTQDLNQFTGRGIPMISELAKQFGVAESKVKELVEAGKVGFPEVQRVIESLTNEGGKFGGLMEEQSKTITGKISNIEDSIFMMFNEIGHQSEGVINTTLSGVSYMIENYERFGRILLGLVGTYGVYRTAIMAVVAMKGWATAAEALHYNWLLLVEKAQKMLNATMLSNPYVLVATLIAGVCVSLVSMKTETERLKEAEEDYLEQKEKVIEAEEEHRRKVEELCSIAGDEAVSTDTRREALNKLEMKYPAIFSKYDTEYEKLKNIKTIKEEIASLDGQNSITRPENELVSVNKRIAELNAIKRSRNRTVTVTGSYGRGNHTATQEGELYGSEKAEYDMLFKKREQLKAQIHKNEANAYFENLTGISNDTLAAEIKRRQELLARMNLEEKKYGKITGSTAQLNGTYTKDELQYQLNKLRSEQSRRNKLQDSSADWAASAKKTYEEALKAYNDFIKSTSNSLSKEDFEKKAKELKDAVDVSKKEYDKVKPETDKDSEAASKQREKLNREAAQRTEIQRKLGLELVALQQENDKAETEAMEEGRDKKLKQIEDEYQARKNAIAKQKSDWEAENAKAGLGSSLSDEQQSALDRASSLAVGNRDKALQEIYKLELQHMQEYLKEYGTYQQRKLAVSEEYDRKIAEASDEWVKKSLEREKAGALQNIEIDAIKQSVDWGSVFGNFGTMFRDQLEPTIEKLKAISRTEEFRNSDLQDRQTLYELISKLEEANTSWDSNIFKSLGDDLTAYQTAMRNYMAAQESERLATEALTKAKEKLAQAEAGGKASEISAAKTEVQTAASNMAEASESVRSFGADVQNASNNLQTSTTRANNMFNTLVSSLSGLKSGSLQGAGESLMSLDKLFNNGAVTNAVGGALSKGLSKLLGNSSIGKSISEALGNSGLMGSIISAILSLLDILKDGIGVLVSSLIDTVLSAVSGILANLLNGKMFVQIGKSLVDGIAGIFDAVTFGGFTSWFSSSNAKEVKETIDHLTERNELLQTAIEDLTDEIKASKGTKSVSAYRDAYRYQLETNANYLGIAQEQAGYHNAHHSWNYYWDGFSREQIDRLSGQIGRKWDGNIWNLSPEEMKILRSNVDMWRKIMDTGKGNYGGRLAEKLDDYINQAGKLEELTTQLYEGLTGITFDTMYDSFVDQLMDMDATAEDFADNISEYFMRAMLSNKIGELYAEKLEEWWKKFGQAMEDNDLSEAERNALSEEYMKYIEEAMKLRDDLAAATGYGGDSKGTSQSGKAGSYSAMSQDQGTKLEGLFVSVQGHVANIDSMVENVADRMSRAESYLAKIADNTESNAKSAEEIKEILMKIARDGIRTK